MTRPKVLLCNPPVSGRYIKDYYCTFTSAADYYWPPQDLYVMSGLLKDAYDLTILDAVAGNMGRDEALTEALASQPDVVIATIGPATLQTDLNFLAQLRRGSTKPYLIGSGGMFRNCGSRFLSEWPELDAVTTYPVVLNLGIFIADVLQGTATSGYQGISYRQGAAIIPAEQVVLERTLSLAPALHKCFPYQHYRHPFCRDLPLTILAGSFGCPFRCSFCCITDFPYLQRKPEEIVGEIAHVVALGFKSIVFVDPTMNLNRTRLIRICQGIIEQDLHCQWVGNMRADLLDFELIDLMARAGCSAIMLGIESGDRGLRESMGKKLDTTNLRAVIKRCRNQGIETLGYFVLGFPTESPTQRASTISLARTIGLDFVSFTILTLDWGADLHRSFTRTGLLAESWDNGGSPEITHLPQYQELHRELKRARTKALLGFYLAPQNLVHRLRADYRSGRLKRNIYQGLALLKTELRTLLNPGARG